MDSQYYDNFLWYYDIMISWYYDKSFLQYVLFMILT